MEMPEWLQEGADAAGASVEGSAAGVVEQARFFVAGVADGLDVRLLELADRQFADTVELASGARTGEPVPVDGRVRGFVEAAGPVLIDAIRELENVKNAACAAQAKAEVLFEVIERTRQVQAGVGASALGRGTVLAVAFARRESQWMASRHMASAARIVREMPRTLEACSNGILSERRAAIIESGTDFLTREQRGDVDQAIAGDPDTLEVLGDKELDAAVKQMAYAFDREAFTKRLHKAESERHVNLKPVADGMAELKALLPLKHGVAVLKTLTAVAESARNAGDKRTKGQLMADVLTHRLCRHLPCDGEAQAGPADQRDPAGQAAAVANSDCLTAGSADIHLDLIMTDRALFDGAADPAVLTGYSPIPGPAGRELVLNSAGQAQVWLRRLYTHPEANALMSMDSRSRLFPDTMKRFLFDQDQICANPWCGAPIRDYDHIKSFTAGGPTAVSNGQGLCQGCNLAKEAPGWESEAAAGPDGRPITLVRTPTGHSYSSTRPVLPGRTRGRGSPRRTPPGLTDPQAEGPRPG